MKSTSFLLLTCIWCLSLVPMVWLRSPMVDQIPIRTVKSKTFALQEARTVQGEAREQVVTLCSLGVYYWPGSSSQIDYFIVLPWTSVARDLWLTQARQSVPVTLTLGKELCGFDLLPNREVLTCSASGLNAERVQRFTLPDNIRDNLESGGRPGSCKGGALCWEGLSWFSCLPLIHQYSLCQQVGPTNGKHGLILNQIKSKRLKIHMSITCPHLQLMVQIYDSCWREGWSLWNIAMINGVLHALVIYSKRYVNCIVIWLIHI